MNTLIGRKIDQTQKFLGNGKRVPVTLIAVSDNAILQVKTLEKDGYAAMQLGFGTKKKANKATSGHSKKAGFGSASDYVREVLLADGDAPVAGENLAIDAIFKPGDVVTVSGISKGKGFAGVVKRHNFRGGPKTHGQSDRLRAPGSIGQTTTPGRVYRGKKMAGRMGSDKVSVSNLTVVGIDLEKKTLLVAGLVPGSKQSIVTITKTGERKNFSELNEDKLKREAQEAIEAEKAAKIAAEEAEKAAIEAEKAAKLAESSTADAKDEKEAAKAPKVEEASVEAAPEAAVEAPEVVTAEETVVEPAEAVSAPAEEVAVEEVKASASASTDAEAMVDKEEPAADETVTEITEVSAEEVSSTANAKDEKEEAEATDETKVEEEEKK